MRGKVSMSRAAEPRRCPICAKPQDLKFRPFCSQRCADIDLAKWFGGGYAIPVVESDDSPSGTDGGEDSLA
jgi:endogenous inhibitor of DNA gyrase (YacG/DUF329 family)